MLSYHNDAAIKAIYVERFAQHRAADAVIQGQGYENGRGCFVGCTLQAYNHSQFPLELGWPEWLARLADTIFESLPEKQAAQFGTDLLNAVPVGADLNAIKGPFLLSIQRRNLERLKDNKEPYAQQCRDAIQGVIAWLETGMQEAQRSAYSAARSAGSAARSAADSAGSAAYSAYSAAYSTDSAARSAADSADSAAYSADSADSAAYSTADSAGSAARSAGYSGYSAYSARYSAYSAARLAESQFQRDNLLTLLTALEVAA